MKATDSVVSEISPADKMKELIRSVDSLSKQVVRWQGGQDNVYSEALEALGSQVDEVRSELDNMSSRIKSCDERLESLFQSSPGVTKKLTPQHLLVRVTRLEGLVSELTEKFKSDASIAKKQFIACLVALGVAVVLWGTWMWVAVIR